MLDVESFHTFLVHTDPDLPCLLGAELMHKVALHTGVEKDPTQLINQMLKLQQDDVQEEKEVRKEKKVSSGEMLSSEVATNKDVGGSSRSSEVDVLVQRVKRSSATKPHVVRWFKTSCVPWRVKGKLSRQKFKVLRKLPAQYGGSDSRPSC